MRALLIYPNSEGFARIPIGLSVLAACLKKHGHEVDLFDLTFLMSENTDNKIREEIGIVKKVDTEKYWGKVGTNDLIKLLSDKIKNFNPGLIGISLIQNNYWAGLDLLKTARNNSSAHIVAGGIFSTVIPDVLLKSKLVDSIILGEGEEAIVELADKIESGENIESIKNLAFMKNDTLQRNPIRKYVDLNTVPCQDLSLFDERHFFRPFDGKMLRAGYVELTRGCSFGCTYCVNYFLNKKLYYQENKHIRFKDVEYSIEEARYLQDVYKFNFIYFADENMLELPLSELKKYAKLWNKHIRLPFYSSCRVELASEEKVKILKKMGCATLAFGIECGNEEFRRKILRRFTTNNQIIKTFNLCKKYGIRTTANNMFGFPYETEKLIFDTIKLNIEIKPDSFALSIFAPYMGTNLYDICLKEGYVQPGIPEKISIREESILEMPQISKARIRDLYANFVKYVSGELPIENYS